jgi:hypothetical protein
MQEQEIAKGSSFALRLVLRGETTVDLAQELRDAKAALVRWHTTRQDKCGAVMFQVASPAAAHREMQRLLEKLYRDEEEPGPFLRALRAQVALCDEKGKPVRQYLLGDMAQAVKAEKPAGAAAAAAAAPAPATPPAEEEDDRGAYGLADAPLTLPTYDEKKEKKKEDKPRVERTIKKKRVQFADEWQAVRLPFMLFMIGLWIWAVVWLIQAVVLVFALVTTDVTYSRATEALFTPKNVQEYDVGEYDKLKRVQFAIALLMGPGNRTLGQALFITAQSLTLVQQGLWLTAYFLCLTAPNMFGSRGQVIALICLGSINLIVTIVLKLLPTVGAMTFAQLPLIVPELPLSWSNVDRTLPLHAFWSWSPFWSYFVSLLLTYAFHAEAILFVIYLWTVSQAITDEVLPEKTLGLMQLGFGQAFMLLAFHMMTIAGTSEVLIIVLWIVNGLWRGFLLGFIIYFAVILQQARTRVVAILEEGEADEDEEEEEEDDDDED